MTDDHPIPSDFGMHGLCPHLVCHGAADAMEFYKIAFGATEIMRLPGPSGKLMHGSMRINNCMVMLADEFGDVGPEHRTVAHCDAWIARAAAAGAKIISAAEDMFWGDRYGQIEDPWGHRWSIATPIGPLVMGDALIDAMNRAM
jgi:PhnB protein